MSLNLFSPDKPVAPTPQELDHEIRRLAFRRSRRAFVVMAAAGVGGYGFYHWISRSPIIGELQLPLRRAEEWNAAIFRKIFHERGLAPIYPVSEAVADPRLNGNIGLNLDLSESSWRLQLTGLAHPERYPQYTEDVESWAYESNADQPSPAESQPFIDNSKGTVEAPAKQAGNRGSSAPKAEPHTLKGTPLPMTKGKGPIQLSEPQTIEVQTPAPGASKPEPRTLEGTPLPMSKGTGPIRLSEAQTIEIETPASGSSNADKTPGLLLTMDDLRKLPHYELVTEFKCIEGWSQIVHWGGARFADFIKAYPPASSGGHEPGYVYMETPDGEYYCGYDMESCRHPQSLLVYEMSGAPLSKGHGAPLRLHMPIKYGYKQIKQIGLIRYTDARPDDFWAKLGYDWYAGL